MMRRTHRSLGAGVAMFVVFMVITGLAINHASTLGLARQHVSSTGLLDWYGIEGPKSISSYRVGEHWVSFAGSQLYFNDSAISTITDGIGAVSVGNLLVVAGGKDLLLLDSGGSLVERIPWGSNGEAPIEAIGLLADGRVVVKTSHQLWLADAQLLGWRQAGATTLDPAWSSAGSAPETLQQAITYQYRGDGLSLERVLLDLHSGRIFGFIGVVIYDLLALAVGFLAISGLMFWFRTRRNSKGNADGK